jgi:hypothetical protein
VLTGVVCAVVAACCYAVGVALQALDARRAHAGDALKASLLLALARRPRFVAGTVISLAGYPLQALALAKAPLAVVQPALAINLVVLLAIAHRIAPEPVGRGEVLGALWVTGGVTMVALAAPAQGHDQGRRTLVCVAALIVLSVLPLLARGLAQRGPLALPAAAGVGYTLLAVATRLADDTLSGRRWIPLAGWLAVVGLAAYAGTVCELTALRTRAPTVVVPLTVSVESVLPVVLAPLVLAESLPGGAGARTVLVAGVALVVAGVALLGRAPALAELRHEAG